jgi:hypothetical protein
MNEIHVYLASNLFSTYILYRFMGLFFDRTNTDSRKEILAFLAYFTINSTAYLTLANPFVNLISTVVMFFLITFLHEGRTRTRIIATLFTYVTAMMVDSLVYNAINGLLAVKIAGNILSIPSNLLLFMLVLILEKLFKRNTDQEVNKYQIIAIIAIPAGSVSIIVTLFIFGYKELPTVIVSLVLLAINLITFYLYDELLKHYANKFENEILSQQNKAYKNQFEIINGAQKSISMLRHDMRNHIIAIRELVSVDNHGALSEYLDSLSETVDVDDEYVRSGNRYVDSILNYKINEAKKEGIEVDVSVAIPEEINIQPFDMSVVIGNLFDNAVEAVIQLSRKTIRIEMKMDRSVLFIRTANPYAGEIEKNGDVIKSTKDDAENHGLGLKSVKNSIKKYNGIMDIDFSENIFEVNLMMYN